MSSGLFPVIISVIVDGAQSGTSPVGKICLLAMTRFAEHPYRFETSILPDFWANDSSFYERLLDDNPEAIESFKALIDDR